MQNIGVLINRSLKYRNILNKKYLLPKTRKRVKIIYRDCLERVASIVFNVSIEDYLAKLVADKAMFPGGEINLKIYEEALMPHYTESSVLFNVLSEHDFLDLRTTLRKMPHMSVSKLQELKKDNWVHEGYTLKERLDTALKYAKLDVEDYIDYITEISLEKIQNYSIEKI